jgi:hypothetical protein
VVLTRSWHRRPPVIHLAFKNFGVLEMKVCAPLRFRVVLGVLAATLSLLAMPGCSGGWGEFKPAIVLQQGRAQTVNSGQSATFTVSATGTGPFTYQWYLNGAAIAGATSSAYTTGATVSGLNGSVYTVAVTSAGGTTMSSPYLLTVNTPPAITTQPASQTITVGQTATFTAAATGTAPLSYQWYEGGVAITGATGGNYTTPATTSLGNVLYTVVVSNVAGTATSGAATLTLEPIGPTLSFAPVTTQTYGGAAFAVGATSASSGIVTYSVASGPATVVGNMVTATGVGTIVLNASQAANGNYAAATTTTSIPVITEVPTLSFAPVASQTYGSATFEVSATSASSGAVTYSVASGPATIVGNMVTATGAGTIVLNASQAANGNYAAATTTTSIPVTTEVPTLSFAPIATQTYGGAAFAVSATSASSGAVTYSVASGPATIVGNVVTTTGAGTIVLNASQAANGNYAAATTTSSVTVNNSIPVASSLAGSASTPPYGTSITLVPTFSGGTAVIGSAGAGSSNITSSAISGSSYPASALTSVTTYTLTVTGTGGNSVSTTFSATPTGVTVTPVTPATQTIAPGQQNFSATASGGATDNLTWTASEGSITSSGVWTSPDVPGTYTITATSADEPSVSASTVVTVSKPIITTQPMSKNACTGYNPSLTTTASYATSYQWYFNGNSLAANSPTLTLSNVTTANNGIYSCSAINSAGLVSSNAVTLNVVSATTLAITKQPSSKSVYATQTATFSVAANGTGTLAYQWYTGAVGSGTAISGATSSTYTTGALTTVNNGATYYVTVSDPDCTGTTVTSSVANLTVTNTDTAVPPTIAVQPIGETATVGGTAMLSVTASGSGTLSYQWYRVAYSSTELSMPTAGVAISGATGTTYTVPSTATRQSNDGDNYFVTVTSNYGSAVSNRVVLAVGAGIALQITANPHTDYVSAGTLASFTVGATCTGCIPSYQWYWYAPGSTAVTALSNGAVSSGALAGATVAGATTSSITLQNVPVTASAGLFYAVVTSTSDGTSTIAGTNALTTSTAGLFVGSLGTVGNATTGKGLCNSAGANWVLNGNNPGTSGGNQPYQNTSACSIQLTNDQGSEHAAVYWPTLISTANFSVSFTVAMSASGQPADGFTMVLADPSQGATTASIGALGEGLGADGIPGFVLGFDTYQNGDGQGDPSCTTNNGGTNVPCDPVPVPYMAVGQGATRLWENPWTFVNGKLDTQNSADYNVSTFANATHAYMVTVVNSIMTVTMDGNELFTGTVSLPPAAYLGFTASTGGSEESVTFSALTATVSAP